jgi:hypothetical protein
MTVQISDIRLQSSCLAQEHIEVQVARRYGKKGGGGEEERKKEINETKSETILHA